MTSEPFDPARYLTRVNGNPYLEVKYRLVWLRTAHPDAEVFTELVDHGDGWAICRATIRIPTGGVATGYAQETIDDFRDYLEKAETKAIGRALSALGYGTQFAVDHEAVAVPRGDHAAPPRGRQGPAAPPSRDRS